VQAQHNTNLKCDVERHAEFKLICTFDKLLHTVGASIATLAYQEVFMMKTKLLPASMAATVAVLLLTGLYTSDEADMFGSTIVQPVGDMPRESFLERATRTRASELIDRVDSRLARQCQCDD
jgi:hypothetical protein